MVCLIYQHNFTWFFLIGPLTFAKKLPTLEEEQLWLAMNQDKTKGEDLKAAEKQKTLWPGQQAERELLSNQRAVVKAHSCSLLKSSSSSSKEVQEVSFES